MKSQTKIFLFTTLDMSTIKDLKSMKINSINSLYLIISKVNEYFEEINKKRYLTLVLSNKENEKMKKYDELRRKIRDLIRLITKNLHDYNEKYMKIKFNSDDDLPLNKK